MVNAKAAVRCNVNIPLTCQIPLPQVRDMIGDGSIIKRRLHLGTGEFPIDCPVEDTTVRIHYRVRPMKLQEGQSILGAISRRGAMTQVSSSSSSDWVFDSRHTDSDSSKGEHKESAPIEFDTGENQSRRKLLCQFLATSLGPYKSVLLF
jgi:hypothetical protein